jgi:NitT/TauT family transport system substrate-binding protein
MSWVNSARPGRVPAALVALAVASTALSLAACGGSDESSAGDGGSDQQRTVKMAFPVPLGLFWSGYIIANERFYPEMGLNVEFVSVDSSASVAQQIATGNAFAGIVADREIYAAAEKGAEIVSIAENGHGPVANIGVPDDSSIESLAELRGEAIGVPSASDGSIAIVKELMSQAGVPEGDYELPAVGVGGPAVAAALKSGRIAAYAHGISDIAPLQAKGGITLRSLVPPRFAELPSDGVVVKASAMETPADRETAIDIARGYIQGWQFLVDNRDEAKEIICEAVPRECSDQELVDAALDVVAKHYEPPGGGRSGAQDYAKLQLLLDMTLPGEHSIPVQEVFTNEYVPAINKGLDAAGGGS